VEARYRRFGDRRSGVLAVVSVIVLGGSDEHDLVLRASLAELVELLRDGDFETVDVLSGLFGIPVGVE